MSVWENGLANYVEGRLAPMERAGTCYSFRSNSFAGRIMRYNGTQGYINSGKKGLPDYIALIKGRFCGFEFKTKNGRQAPEQKEAQRTIESAGGKYYVVHTPDEFEGILAELL